MMRSQALLIMLLTFRCWILAERLELNEDIRNVMWSITSDIIIHAWNNRGIYWIYIPTQSQAYIALYRYTELYVYSLCGLTMGSRNDTFAFLQIAQNVTSNEIVLSRVTLKFSHLQPISINVSTPWIKPETSEMWKEKYDYQSYLFLKIDQEEKYAYVLADSFLLTYDLSTNVHRLQPTNGTFYGDIIGRVIPHAFSVIKDKIIIVAFVLSRKRYVGYRTIFFVEVSSLTLRCPGTRLKIEFFDTSGEDDNELHYNVPVSINPSGTLVAIGHSHDKEVTVYKVSSKEPCSNISSIPRNMKENRIGFGVSLTWLDDYGTLAVLMKNLKLNASSKIEIRVYKDILRASTIDYDRPDFVLPNKQQFFDLSNVLYNTLNDVLEPDLSSVRILGQSNSILFFGNDIMAFYIASVDAGYHRNKINDRTWPIITLDQNPCVSGSYKNLSGIGPCTICPPGTKNPGNNTNLECQPCKSSSFCPLGASDDVNLNDFLSYNQTFVYPQSPIIDDYDDLLLRNFFSTETNVQCIIRLPLFWALVTITIIFLGWILMLIINIRRSAVARCHRQRIKCFLKQIDLIGEGERLAGGLATLVVLTLIIHSSWFAHDYLHSYPIEKYNSRRQHCKNNQINTKFDNALQLLIPSIDGTYPTIAQMLDQQQLMMTVFLINTGVQHADIIVERISHMASPRPISLKYSNLSNSNATLSFTFNVTHSDVVQVTVKRPFFIGALRLCLNGAPATQNTPHEVHNLRELDMCTLFYTDNETIGLSTDFTVKLIKVINNTEPLNEDDDEIYDGRWAPYMICNGDLSDEHYFRKDGEYLRYALSQTTFTVRFNEENYFLENNQSPVIRRYELVFHTFLFGFLLVDIFAMIIVVYKLWLRPVLRRLLPSHHCSSEHELQSCQTRISNDVSYFNEFFQNSSIVELTCPFF